MLDQWIERWREGRTGWHEVDGSALLRRHWPRLVRGSRVLVPLCGKSVDMLWLASQGLEVTGVELSEIAVRAFFDENELDAETVRQHGMPCYRSSTVPISICCGDYLAFSDGPFDALFDRGGLVAMPAELRPRYAEHTTTLLAPDAYRMIITLEYDQDRVAGPPFSVTADELRSYWPDLECVHSHNDIDKGSPKFRQAGLAEVIESVWTSS